MSQKVYITGIGLISALGGNVQENFQSLKDDKTGIGKITMLDSIHKDKYLAGEIKVENNELAKRAGINVDTNLPRTTLLALIASREAVENAKINLNDGYRTGVISGTTVGGMDKTEQFYQNLEQETDFIKSHSCGYTTEQVADYLGVKDYVATISTACSTGANSLMLGARLIKKGIVDRVVAGGSDSLSKFTLNGFKTLMILSPGQCKPFDANRKGLNLGEGSGFVVLESERIVKEQNKQVYAELTGYANANDAYHQTATSPTGDGLYLCMTTALKMAGLQSSDIGYLNTHGTATDNNDVTESAAIKRVFGEEIPRFSSTKSFTGHTLGAAGGIESVFSILALNNNIAFANLNFETPIAETGLIPQLKAESSEMNHVMNNSFGFGGSDTTLIFSKVKKI